MVFSPLLVIGMEIDISHFVTETKVLGPFIRSALWVHGCCFNCPGCVAYDMNRADAKYVSVDYLAEQFIAITGTEGITISGGEPFLQAEALSELIKLIRTKRPDYGVIIYTGFVIEALKEKRDSAIDELISLADIIIDGNYVRELDDGKPYRGSSNQRILLISDRYRTTVDEYYSGDKRNIEIKVTEKNIYMVGVPSEYGLKTWKELKRKAEVGNND